MLRPLNLARFRGWQPYSWSREPFKALSWPDLLDRYWDMADRYPEQLAMVEILHSVVNSDAVNRLAGNYTINGLHIVDVEHREPPYSVITVETYGRAAAEHRWWRCGTCRAVGCARRSLGRSTARWRCSGASQP
jgi:hypothetical protein